MTEEVVPTGALEKLAIFPLPDVVLFPGAMLPLHLFEPRYRDLASDVVGSTRLLAVARLKPGYEQEYEGRPPVFETAGLGYVLASEKTEDGRYQLLLRGVGRVQIETEHPADRTYREVVARALIDTRSTRPDQLDLARTQLIALCDRLAGVLDEGGDELKQLVRAMKSPASCADLVAAALITNPDERQTLLETLDPADRLDKVIDRVAELTSQLGDGSQTLN